MEHNQEDQVALARAVLLFFDTGPWTTEKQKEWFALTGRYDATTKTLGSLARRVLGEQGS